MEERGQTKGRKKPIKRPPEGVVSDGRKETWGGHVWNTWSRGKGPSTQERQTDIALSI